MARALRNPNTPARDLVQRYPTLVNALAVVEAAKKQFQDRDVGLRFVHIVRAKLAQAVEQGRGIAPVKIKDAAIEKLVMEQMRSPLAYRPSGAEPDTMREARPHTRLGPDHVPN
jgi:hypothetical protein